jgi:hypothetical protein
MKTFAVLAALTIVAAAVAAPVAKDPAKLILRQADFPRGAQYEADPGDCAFKRVESVTTGGASYLGASYSNAAGFLQVSGVVCTSASVAQAKKAFAAAKAELARLARQLRSDAKPIALPKYGDQQAATYAPAGGEGIHILELLVRKRTVVWLIAVKRETRPPIPKAKFLDEAKKYALKQKSVWAVARRL